MHGLYLHIFPSLPSLTDMQQTPSNLSIFHDPQLVPLRCIHNSSPALEYNPESPTKMLCRLLNKHMGQMKLLLSEIDFLSDFARAGDTVVYAGAADGEHIPTLDCMFQSLGLVWHLFDPSRFSTRVMQWMSANKGRVFVYRRCFLTEDAIYFKPFHKLLFICDIRTKENDCSKHAMPDDSHVMCNQQAQMEWVRYMDPVACCLKFRGAFGYAEEAGAKYRHFQYLKGELRIQAWPKPNSTELRLVARRPYCTKMYSSKQLDEAMSHYNENARLMSSNDLKLQNYILGRYMEHPDLSLECRTKGRQCFDQFERDYCSRRAGTKGVASSC